MIRAAVKVLLKRRRRERIAVRALDAIAEGFGPGVFVQEGVGWRLLRPSTHRATGRAR